MQTLSPFSEATTQGIRVTVRAAYLPQRSEVGHYFFAYTITIRNDGSLTAQLHRRHWMITDSNNQIEEVEGPGVVGETPILPPGESFTYTSACVLRTPFGMMRGTYQMTDSNDESFDVEIAPFLLAPPYGVN